MFDEYAALLERLTYKYVGSKLTDLQINQFCKYGDLLLEWNQKLNLTRIIEPEDVILKHFIDSMVLSKYMYGVDFADLGTGAGFPGVPLKILRPELKVVLVDSLKKRLDFLDVVIETLSLTEIHTVHTRAEDFGRDSKYRGRFETVSSRAVARLPILLEYALPVLKINGLFLAAKGIQAENEMADSEKAIKILGGKCEGREHYNLGEGAEHRAIILIRKIKQTPAQYPRKAGIPSKKPIQ
ncbi:16S rRNA (guanine(527)-N(7))-methyltransferase GidB [Desulfosporosinus orientis DSM 765]|uniref:Ribosomal RNA small subunit methyltransferase G n=1 Tax=Desulfosporosinus orientis (strain ATCC 19365 / DSM 765 / NCIMB 8382 / VKM B-1628 / Singapore I) TaxID=768706 RepID=G7WI77_DESOD|nr:16S rRNA (guanine(527)-N(7))-methyltransferase RsmG [Desulfosporosinus orientis]AET71000.1 16S rRNA (guanine(527)-N(7))-methyltransferase GidB [Desulfosporosinus orientis DSM 765]